MADLAGSGKAVPASGFVIPVANDPVNPCALAKMSNGTLDAKSTSKNVSKSVLAAFSDSEQHHGATP